MTVLRPLPHQGASVTINGLDIQIRGAESAVRQELETITGDELRNYEINVYVAGLRSRQPDGHGYVIFRSAWDYEVPLNGQEPGWKGTVWDETGTEFPDPQKRTWPCVYAPEPHEGPDEVIQRRGWGPGWYRATIIGS